MGFLNEESFLCQSISKKCFYENQTKVAAYDTNCPEYNRTLNVMGSLTVGNKDKVNFTV